MEIIYALKENIGVPELFTGRRAIMENFEHWLYNIRKEIGKSRALLSRRKKGKTVIMQRLYNIIWTQNDSLVPFFYEIREQNMMLGEFAEDFITSFLSQYYAFLTRKKRFIVRQLTIYELQELFKNDINISELLKSFLINLKNQNCSAMWKVARVTPHSIAVMNNIQVLQFIDEFQNINKYILDSNYKPIKTLAGSYLLTAESRCAPMLVTGSYIGWLRRIIWELLPARFNEFQLGNLEEKEGLLMIFKYAQYYEIPITYKTGEYILGLTGGDPYYISIIFEGTFLGKKNFNSINNINDVYEHEITKGNIKGTWYEYLFKAFSEVNNINAKRMVLYLFNANGKERTREQIMTDLKLDMTDFELEKKLKALVYSDIISQGESNFDYKISNDKIYEFVFRNIYQKEIDKIGQDVGKALRSQIGKHSYDIGHFYEYKFETIFNKGFILNDITYNGDKRTIKAVGEIYRNYIVKETRLRNMEIDVYGINETGEEVFMELKTMKRRTGVKNIEKYIRLKKKLEKNKRPAIFIFFATAGFTKKAELLLIQNSIFYGDATKYPVMKINTII